MNNVITLRQAKVSSDLERMKIVSLHDRLFGGDGLKMPSLDEGYWWVAIADRKIVGFAGTILSPFYKDTTYLIRVGVDPAYQGNGIMKRLLRAAQSHSKRIGMEAMVTDTSMDNIPSMASLISSGWKLWEPDVPWGLNHSLYWFRELG